ncbi:MAG: HAD-IIB family hydrolase [Patescibacteria group bacterium]|nr:HAD-IIB family hydrolase [Patescibacteria group bacterium]
MTNSPPDIRMKKLVIFDLDGTLAPSKSPMSAAMGALIVRLLKEVKVAVISGSGYKEFEANFLSALPAAAEGFANLFLLPASGTRLLVWRSVWCEEYAEHLAPREKEAIMAALNAALAASGVEKPAKTFGPAIEDRGSQVTFSANGQDAPLAVKERWDPSGEKRRKIADAIKEKIPGFDVRIGGTNSIDITRRGVNKGYGIRKLEEHLHMHIDDMVFVGDKLMPGGNDYPAKATGIDCVEVKGPEETEAIVSGWLG